MVALAKVTLADVPKVHRHSRARPFDVIPWRQGAPNNLAVVQVYTSTAGKHLIIFVSLTGYHDDIAGHGFGHGLVYGLDAVQNNCDLARRVNRDTGGHCIGYGLGVFIARIVRGDDDAVGSGGGRGAPLVVACRGRGCRRHRIRW